MLLFQESSFNQKKKIRQSIKINVHTQKNKQIKPPHTISRELAWGQDPASDSRLFPPHYLMNKWQETATIKCTIREKKFTLNHSILKLSKEIKYHHQLKDVLFLHRRWVQFPEPTSSNSW